MNKKRMYITYGMLVVLVIMLFTCVFMCYQWKKAKQLEDAIHTTGVETKDLRVVFSSDLHFTEYVSCHDVDMDVRMQHWVDSVLLEHKRNPIDLLVINGDISLDHWNHKGWADSNAKCVNCGMSSTIPRFTKKYLDAVKKEIPVFVMPGNHELYTEDEWIDLVGNKRQGSKVIKNTLFLFMDNYKSKKDVGKYTPTDVDYINKQLKKYPDYDVYIVAHAFDLTSKDSTGELVEKRLQDLLNGEQRIKGLFAGHSHGSRVVSIGEAWGNKTIAQTGNFSYSFNSTSSDNPFWGFRELIITEDSAYSQYISVDGIANDAQTGFFKRKITDSVWYK